jgi:hypothetical protein
MLGLRLGEFGKGFVKGFAEEANEALKNDIQRINTRVEKVADFRVKRAVEEQEERKKDLEDIKDALREAEGLFGKDDPRASAYAASLLKDQGSTSALRAFVSEIKGSDAYKRGESLTNYMQQMEQDMPQATRSEYAQAFLGKPRATPDYRLPEDAVTAGAGNLISALGFKPDVSGRIERETAEQMAAMGVGAPVTTEVTLPSAVFQKERWMLTNKTPTQRLEYINNQLANPENTEERITELNAMREKALVAVENTGNLQDQITVKETRLSTATGEEAATLMEEIAELKQDMALRDAQTSDNPMDLIDANINIALRKAIKSGDYTEYRRLVDEKNRMGKEPTLVELIAKAKEDLAMAVRNGDIIEGSDEYNTAMASIRKDEKILEDMKPDKPINVGLANSWGDLMQEAIDADVISRLPAETRGQYVEVKKLIEANPDKLATLRESDDALYKIYMQGQAIEKEVRVSAIERVLSGINEQDNPDAFFAARSIFNYGGAAQSAAISAGAETGVETAAGTVAAGEEAVSAQTAAVFPPSPESRQAEIQESEAFKKQFPMSAEGATKIISNITATEKESGKMGDPEDVYNAAIELHGDEAFAAGAEYMASKGNSGLSALEKEIAGLALDGLNVNEIIINLKQGKYKGDPSFDVASITSTVSRVLAEITPEARRNRIESMRRAAEYEAKRQEQAAAGTLGPKTGLMSR